MRQRTTLLWLSALCTCIAAAPPLPPAVLGPFPIAEPTSADENIGEDTLPVKERIRRKMKNPGIIGPFKPILKSYTDTVKSAQDFSWEREEQAKDKVQTCDETNAPGRYMIYCSGKLLQAVMAVKLHNDSKTFVDRPMKEGTVGEKVLAEFEKKFPHPVNELQRDDVKQFVDEYFDEEGQELMSCELHDWTENPAKFKVIKDKNLHTFALKLNKIWKNLCRQVKPEVKNSPERFSLIYVPHPFIVPGGRFREFYYWDAYWIVKGLLVSGMTETAKYMILNFAYMIENYGFVPNGGRIYYLRRSQPPMFTPMVYEYYLATRDKKLIEKMLPVIEKEIKFWDKNRTVTVKVEADQWKANLYQYRTPSTVPRPESYREDIISAESLEDDAEKRLFYQNIASAAESGWDFSIRWFADQNKLASIETTNILPVDLNAYMCYNIHILATLYGELGNDEKSKQWQKSYQEMRYAFNKIFYVEEAKGWYDFNFRTGKHNTDFYASMAAPLFTQCFEPLSTNKLDDLYNKLVELGVFNFTGGIPTSLQKSSTQQWDFPNGWSPLNHMMIEGLRKSDDPRLQYKAIQLAEKWLYANYRVFQADNAMWEKYDVVSTKPRLGAGGEYDVQPGFGWTNGVALDLLYTYGDILTLPEDASGEKEKRVAGPSDSEQPLNSQSSVSSKCLIKLIIYTVISRRLYVHIL